MRHRTSRQAGFSLAELLITALIFGIGLLGLAALQVSTMRSNSGGRNRFTAVALSEGCMSAIQAEGSLSWSYAAGVMGTAAVFPVAARTYTGGNVGGTFGTFDVDGKAVVEGDPSQIFKVTWTRLTTAATPGVPITNMNLNEFVVTVTWRDQVVDAKGVSIPASTLTVSRLIRY
jgi:prepilin-type N-terminal cleavage/methylation domain-containing protein